MGGIGNGFFATDQVNVFGAPSPFLYKYAVDNKLVVGNVANAWNVADPTGNTAGTNYAYGPGFATCFNTGYFNNCPVSNNGYSNPVTPIKGVYYGNLQEGHLPPSFPSFSLLFLLKRSPSLTLSDYFLGIVPPLTLPYVPPLVISLFSSSCNSI